MTMVFAKLEQNYVDLAARARLKPEREHELQVVCDKLRRGKPIYQRVEQLTHVPAAALMALAMREMSGKLTCYLGNGQSLKQRTTIVPKNRGPFLQPFPEDFVAGCLDSLAIDHLDQVWKQGGWTLPRFCFESEEWNGWGYRSRGIPSPYVFGATTVQRPGKFPRDHFFDPNLMDPQLGTLAIVLELVKQDPSLAFFDGMPKAIEDAPSIAPAAEPVVVPHPVLTSDPRWVQAALNKLHYASPALLEDGNVGPRTRDAVRAFEIRNHLQLDRGIPGPQVVARLKQVLAEVGIA
jgi:lysozyme family protein